MENAGGSYAVGTVISRLTTFYTETKVQPLYDFPVSQRAGRLMESSYSRFAAYLNIDASELHFGPSTSSNTYVLANAFRGVVRGGNIVLTEQEHYANLGVWLRMAKEENVEVRMWKVDPLTGELNIGDLDRLLCADTRLVAMTHCSNVIGQVNPVKEVTAKTRRVNASARVVVDGVGYCGHGFPDVKDLDVDVYLCSLYKVYGPHLGLMAVRERAMDELSHQGHCFLDGIASKRLVPSGPDHAQIAAASGILDYFDTIYAHHFLEDGQASADVEPAVRCQAVRTLFSDHERRLSVPILQYLREQPGRVKIIGPAHDADNRCPTIAFLPLGAKTATAIAAELGDRGVGVGAGAYYANPLLEAMGLPVDPGLVRISLVHYNSHEDVQHLLAELDAVLKA